MSEVLFLVNARSGRVHDEGAEAIEASLRGALPGEARARFVRGDVPELLAALDDAVAEVGTVATVGGDGTIGAVAGRLAGRKDAPRFVPLPYGTANLIPRDVGLPLDPVEALGAAMRAGTRRIDYATANEAPLLHSAVFGTFAEVAEEREHLREAERLGARLSALGAAAGKLFGAEAKAYRLVIDGEPLEATTNTVFVTNNAITGGERGVPQRERLDAGHLVAYVSDSTGPMGFLQRVIEAGTGGFDGSNGIVRHFCREAVVSAEGGLAYSRDGEVEAADSVAFRIQPGALAVPDLRG